MAGRPESTPLASTSLRAYFHESVQDAARNQQIDARDETLWYLTDLLARFSRSEQLFDDDAGRQILRPLAELHAQASNCRSPRERQLVLQRLGDIALFISGLFSGLFTRRRRLVDVDYYMAMGGGAYAAVCDELDGTVRGRSLGEVFEDLSRGFVRYADVLGEVGEQAFGSTDHDLLRIHERWSRTDSPRLARKLREAGIEPRRLLRAH